MKNLIAFVIAFSFIQSNMALTITSSQDLNFGVLVQGDSSKTIKPVKSENSNARFDIVGEPHRSFTIILPAQATLVSQSNSSATLNVSDFSSQPHSSSSLSNKGKKEMRVGATLQNIPNGQAAGSYSGHFIVDVIY